MRRRTPSLALCVISVRRPAGPYKRFPSPSAVFFFDFAATVRPKPSRSFGRREGIPKSARGYGAEDRNLAQFGLSPVANETNPMISAYNAVSSHMHHATTPLWPGPRP
jgi:hypothetical protein